ncbi:MAG TPA: HYR domain-containing protein [Nitrososphaera sp.]|jgi:hypothetical protein|nr:HYR domain-containing protein [Nitrososphaera sp.]
MSTHDRVNSIGALVVAAVLVFATTGQYAFGDNVVNDVQTTGVGQNDTFTEGDSTIINYKIVATSGPGGEPSGCNVDATHSATVTINVVSGVTASPSSLIFTSCGVNQAVTFSAPNDGTFIIPEVSASGGKTGSTYNTNPTDFTLYVLEEPVTNTPPELTVPSDMIEEATGPSGAAVAYVVTATDAEDNPDPTPSCLPTSGSTFPLGTTTVNCSVTDSGGLGDGDSFTVTVEDTTAPTLTLSADITEEATGPSGATVAFSATAADLVDGDVSVDCTPVSGSVFSLGTTLVSCSASDVAGNDAQGMFNVIVQDTTAPTLALPADMTEEATGPGGAAVAFSASASDLVDGTVPVDCTPASGSTFSLGSTTVNCSAEDAAGNSAGGSFSVTVQDTTPPELTLSGDITEEATGPSGAVVNFVTSATDIVDGPVSVDCNPISGTTFSLGTTVVECSATDAAGNTAEGSFSVTVEDTTPPSLDLPSGITMPAGGISGAIVTYSASATDLVDGTVPVECVPASGSNFPIGATTVNCSAEDNAGNIAEGSFAVSITIQKKGFYQPVDMNSYVNTVKAGSTVPLKFEVFGDMTVPSTEISDVSIVKTLKQKLTSCDPSAPTDEVETTATGGTMLRYDATAGQFIYNWKTPLQKGCYTVTMTFLDDSTIQALFKLK